jgi:hypothetical protein
LRRAVDPETNEEIIYFWTTPSCKRYRSQRLWQRLSSFSYENLFFFWIGWLIGRMFKSRMRCDSVMYSKDSKTGSYFILFFWERHFLRVSHM